MDHERLVSLVSKPARYLGGEANAVVKDPASVRLTMALAFPEVYEIAMSHQGIKVLYEILAARPEIAAERVFCPWTDLMDLLVQEGQAPWSLESGRPLNEFDVVGFSLPYELLYTNLLWMLRLAGIPARREERTPEHPLVIAGGPCMVNPEPMADFLDLAVVGEAEELIHPLMDLFLAYKEEGWSRGQLYRRAADLEGVYAPAFFEPVYEEGRLARVDALRFGYSMVQRRVVADLDAHRPPVAPVLPSVKPVHDRLGLEVARGCTRGCRFCQAGYIYRPVRERAAQGLVESMLEGLERTGLEEAALLSLSAGDYSCIEELAFVLMEHLEPRYCSLSLPSLRVDSLSGTLATQLKRVRKSGFTLAPEAGSQRLRSVINKDLTEPEILACVRRVFTLGWDLVKLYFMVGLPGEEDEDLAGIGRLCHLVVNEAKAQGRGRGKRPLVHASLGIFVPKPHTPFQWEAQADLDEARRRLELARSGINDRRVRLKWNPVPQAMMEGVLARGDRRLSRVLERAVEAGCRYDGWQEQFDLRVWKEALAAEGLSLADYLRARDPEECLPWDHVSAGVSKKFLLDERAKALAGEATADCRAGTCLNCGVCDHDTVRPRLALQPPAPPPAPPDPPAPPQQRTAHRFQLEKTGSARLLGHLEMITQISRAFQRAGVSLAYTQGFHPHPLVKTDSALPLGVESLVEGLEVTVLGPSDPAEMAARVNRVLPSGLRLKEGRPARPGESLREPDQVTYLVRGPQPLSPHRLEQFNQADSALFVRTTPKGQRTIDLKAAIKRMALEEDGLTLVVGRAGGRPKPSEVLTSVFGLSPEEAAGIRALKVGASWGETP